MCMLHVNSRSFTVLENPFVYAARSSKVGANRLRQTSILLTVDGLVSQSNAIFQSLLFIIRRNKLDAFDVAAA
jgi:hypothetical protein